MANSRPVKIAPSILAVDFARLADQVREVELAGADRLHIDVMDGHFVPNVGIGPQVVEALRKISTLPIEVHLMVNGPDTFMPLFSEPGADRLIVHVEGNPHLHRSVERIKSLGCSAGVVINPATPAVAIDEILPDVDLVLVMTVNPGFGGQKFIQSTLPKISRIWQRIEAQQLQCELEVDGGLDNSTAPLTVDAGADVLVAGSAIFQNDKSISDSLQQLLAASRSTGGSLRQQPREQ